MPKSSFTNDEWAVIASAWSTIFSATMNTDPTIVSAIVEGMTAKSIVFECKAKYASNELVTALFAGATPQAAPPALGAPAERLADDVKKLEKIAELLAKAPAEEAAGFKSFLLFAARRIAKASGEELLGGGALVSASEGEFLAKLPTILKMTAAPRLEGQLSLRGRLRTSDGKAAANLGIAIVDEDDLDEDDLIALGQTDDDGAFQTSFLASEFQQDLLEFEETPDIKIHVIKNFDAVPKAIFRKTFPDLDWSTGSVDLGDVVLEGVNLASPVPLEGVEAVPGLEKRAARIAIDHEVLRYCLAEVAPLVERLTGWSGLLDGLKIELATGTSSYTLREAFVGAGKDPTGLGADVAAFVTDLMGGPGAGCAIYDPHIHTLVINTPVMEQINLDAFKVMLGHELVHVGQFKNTPGLKDYNLAHLRGMMVNAEAGKPEETTKREPYMHELEGYAKYIETDFLQKRYYPLALPIYNPSITEQMLVALVAKLAAPEAPASGEAAKPEPTKQAQYIEGRERYRQRQVGDAPARFQLDVSTLYKAGEPPLGPAPVG